jgi:isocitrate dehydrogenase
MFDPAGGTAPDIAGQNVCNPTAMLLSFGMVLDHIDRYDLGHALRLSILDAIAEKACARTAAVNSIPLNLPRKLSIEFRGTYRPTSPNYFGSGAP